MLSVEQFFRLFGRHFEVDGSDGLVRVLRSLFRGVIVGFFGNVLFAVDRADTGERVLLRLRGNADGVRSHVGNEGDVIAVFRLYTLIEVLRETHGFGR